MINNINGIPFNWSDDENDPLAGMFPQGLNASGFEGLRTDKSFEEISKEFARNSPFGDNSIFAKPKPGDFFEGYVDFIRLLWRIGAPMREKDQEMSDEATKLEEVIVPSNDNITVFDYRDFSNENSGNERFWNYRDKEYPGQAILNKKIAYIDREKIFLSDKGRGWTRFSLYIPYANDSNLSLGNFSTAYLEEQAAIKLIDMNVVGLMIILSNLESSKRKVYAEAICKQVARNTESNALGTFGIYFLEDASVKLLQYFSTETLMTLFYRLAEDRLTGSKETIFLKILQALTSQRTFSANKFLALILTKKLNGAPLFQILYEKMSDWGGENNFSKFIIELTKIWILSDYSNPQIKAYDHYEPLPSLVYNEGYILGFRTSGISFEFKPNNDIYMTETTLGFEVPGMSDDITQHPYQPITIISPEKAENEELKLSNGITLPAFYLMAFDDKGVWDNSEKFGFLVLDVLSLYTGVGNLAKLRYLLRAEKSVLVALKTVFGVIQVASSTLSIALTLVDNSQNRDLVNKIREYLFWAEICTLGADVLTSRILAKKAREARDVLAEFRKTVKNEKKLKEIDELAEHLDKVAGKGIFSKIIGKPINLNLLKKLQKEFEKIGGELKFDDESFEYIASRERVMDVEIEAITFNEELIFLNRNVSTSAVYEELIHAKQFKAGKYNAWAKKYGAEGAENLMEKEAAEELLKNASKWKLPENEVNLIKERLEYFKKELNRLKI